MDLLINVHSPHTLSPQLLISNEQRLLLLGLLPLLTGFPVGCNPFLFERSVTVGALNHSCLHCGVAVVGVQVVVVVIDYRSLAANFDRIKTTGVPIIIVRWQSESPGEFKLLSRIKIRLGYRC